ncbi:hypothetical protein MTR67_031415 [Solanum verrucosum]|uniref:Retrotransposon gag domain-containing protein n=1 Tax=Solanum verrucosum TaxID=315347 RepID=A0AAF0ZG28_SOLVR|nr:hypothetical protein MTR67_031415 [Solanum verrucosum]
MSATRTKLLALGGASHPRGHAPSMSNFKLPWQVEEDPQEFIDEMYNVLMIMGVTPVENEELLAYQLKDVAQAWFNQWKEERVVDVGPLDWENFKVSFLDILFPLEMREEKVLEFIKLHKGNMKVKEYALKFT